MRAVVGHGPDVGRDRSCIKPRDKRRDRHQTHTASQKLGRGQFIAQNMRLMMAQDRPPWITKGRQGQTVRRSPRRDKERRKVAVKHLAQLGFRT